MTRVLAALALLVAAGAARAGEIAIARLGGGLRWTHCAVEHLGETRPATACAQIHRAASGKDVVVPPSRMMEVVLDAAAAQGAVRLVTEAFTYAHTPAEPIAAATLKDFDRVVTQGNNDRFLERGFMHEPGMRAAPQPAVAAASLPAELTLRFGADDVGRKVAYAVWAWPATAPPDLHVETEPFVVKAGDGLRIGFGVQDPGWGPGAPPVTFIVSETTKGDPPTPLWSRRLDPARRAGDRGWIDAEVELRPAMEGQVTVELDAHVEGEGATFPVWAQPILVRSPTPAVARTNLLLISLDTVRADHLSGTGYRRATSPVLDAFASEGVRFDQAIAPFPSTTASHMSMLTGLYPCAHRVIAPSVTLAASVTTLAEVLARAGYSTGAVTEDGLIKGDIGFDRGFDAYRDQVWTGDEPVGLFPDTTEVARGWIVRHATDPFFFFLHTYQPHTPFKVPAYYKGLFVVPPASPEALEQEAAYDEGLRYTDDLLASILGWLRRTGLAERTLVVVTSDHGTEFGEHGGIGHARGVYDEQVHVPLVLHHPTLAAGGRRIPTAVSIIDLTPTVLDLLGQTVPEGLQGRSLAPLVRGEPLARGDVFAEQLWGPRQTLLRTDDRAWIMKPGGTELYDVATDPREQHDLAPEHTDEAAAGAARITAFRDACAEVAKRIQTTAAAPLDADRTRALKALGYLQ